MPGMRTLRKYLRFLPSRSCTTIFAVVPQRDSPYFMELTISAPLSGNAVYSGQAANSDPYRAYVRRTCNNIIVKLERPSSSYAPF